MGEELDGTYDCGWTFASNVYDTLALSLLRLLGDVCNTLYRMHKYMLVRYVYIFVLLKAERMSHTVHVSRNSSPLSFVKCQTSYRLTLTSLRL
jgi:hypothetical protein